MTTGLSIAACTSTRLFATNTIRLPRGLHVQVQDPMFHLWTDRLQPLVAWCQVLPSLSLAPMLQARSRQDALSKVQAADAQIATQHSLQRKRGLTIRSTGHFAAVGLWPSFHSWPNANLRKTPVSSNVRPHKNAGYHGPIYSTFVGTSLHWSISVLRGSTDLDLNRRIYFCGNH